MYIGNNFMVLVGFYNHPFHQKYFIDEKSARNYANSYYFDEDVKEIELFQRQRIGYVKVKKIVRKRQGVNLWETK